MPGPCTSTACSSISSVIPGAMELIDRAVALWPGSPFCAANLAETYRALGDFERAAHRARVPLGTRLRTPIHDGSATPILPILPHFSIGPKRGRRRQRELLTHTEVASYALSCRGKEYALAAFRWSVAPFHPRFGRARSAPQSPSAPEVSDKTKPSEALREIQNPQVVRAERLATRQETLAGADPDA
jgi:hypothetical protein